MIESAVAERISDMPVIALSSRVPHVWISRWQARNFTISIALYASNQFSLDWTRFRLISSHICLLLCFVLFEAQTHSIHLKSVKLLFQLWWVCPLWSRDYARAGSARESTVGSRTNFSITPFYGFFCMYVCFAYYRTSQPRNKHSQHINLY